MIRHICNNDIPACLYLYNWYIDHSVATFETEPVTLPDFSERVERITKKYPWLVLEEENEIKGYAYLGSFHERDAYRYTVDLSIYLKQSERGKGYGSKLMEAIIALAKEDGYHSMVSLITEGNLSSEAIHAKFGFTKMVVLPRLGYKFNRWVGVSYWLLKLTESDEPAELQNRKLQ